MTNLTDQIEEELRKDYDVVTKDDLLMIFGKYTRDITHNITLRNFKRTFRLFADIAKWFYY